MRMKTNLIWRVLIVFLLCFAFGCTIDGENNNGNDSNNSNNGGNNGGGNNSSDKNYGSRSEALEALFDNTTLGVITLTITEDQWEQMISNTNNGKKDSYVKADFQYEKDGAVYKMSEIGIRNRGNSTYRAPADNNGNLQQAHFRLKFDEYNDDKAHHMENALKGMNLKFMVSDSSYVQEMYSYDLFRRFGVWTAPHCAYSKLYIKIGDKETAYYGIYKTIEPIGKQYIKARVADEMFAGDEGNLWKCLYQYSGAANLKDTNSDKFGVDKDMYTPTYSLKTNEEDLNTVKEELKTFIKTLNSKSGSEFESWIAESFDVDGFLKTLAVSVACGMWDDYWRNSNNYYLYFDGAKTFFIPYDYDNCLGATNSGLMNEPAEHNPLEWGCGKESPLVDKILNIAEYKEKYKQYLRELVEPENKCFTVEDSKARINTWYDLIRSHTTGYDASTTFSKDGKSDWSFQEGKPSSKYNLISDNNNYFAIRTTAIAKAAGGKLPTYTVTFDSNGGIFTGDYNGQTTVTINDVIQGENPESVVSVTKEDSKFLGWYNGNEKVIAITGNVSLTAKWFEIVEGIFGYKVDTENKKITFTFDPAMYKDVPDNITTVCVLGNFNGWKEENTDYTLTDDGNGVFTGTFELPEHKSEFKYYVNNYWIGAKKRLDEYNIPEDYVGDNENIRILYE